MNPVGLRVAIETFADALAVNFRTRIEAQPEDQLKPPIQSLLQMVGAADGRNVGTRTEARVDGLGARPDVGVSVGQLLNGHVELKAPGRGGRAERFTGADRIQWQKFQKLPNLIYTDGSEWTLYRTGAPVRRVRIGRRIHETGTRGIDAAAAEELGLLLQDFLAWNPIVPASPRALANVLAPLCHLVRQDVLAAMALPGSPLDLLAQEWRRYLFPDADDFQFADAYAQTVTYALLLARFSGATEIGTEAAVRTLSRGHTLLAQALRILTDHQARAEIETGIDLLERSIAAIDVVRLTAAGADPWLYFYEDFLAAYDPRLRKDRGVYYTPVQVVGAQVRLCGEILESRLGKPLAFADEGVVLLDPAVGTGTYPLAAIQHALDRVEARFGAGALAGHATALASNTHAFEILIGPYAVAHLRVTQQILAAGGALPDEGAHVYLTDTLESPHAAEPAQMTLLHRPLSDEHRRAQVVKRDTRVLVCLGNPPYDRQQIDAGDMVTERKGGWVRFGDHADERPILEDFLEPARAAGAGVHLKNLYNDYVYFWRWALWKTFDTTDGPGIVSFITASSYLRGPGFVGMRERMRRTADEIWIIDLEGDNLGPRKTENVFAIQTPVAIAIVARYGEPRPDEPARIHYARIEGTREEKLAALDQLGTLASLAWRDCPSEWQRPFLPANAGDYWSWPRLTDVFPWQHSGVQMKRTWPIGETPAVLEARWSALIRSDRGERSATFHPTRDRDPRRSYRDIRDGHLLPPILSLDTTSASPLSTRYAFRALDRQWILGDGRLGDFMRPALWETLSHQQVFLTGLLTTVLSLGPAAVVCANAPDLHHFRGSFGGKDVIPLWRDAAATEPNITGGLLEALSTGIGITVGPEDLFAYAYAVLATPAYVERFSEELTIPGPHLPITCNAALFQEAVALGRRLVWLHTYAQRWTPAGEVPGRVPQGTARALTPIPATAQGYPERFSFDEATRTLHVGAGSFGPVDPAAWRFSVSGLEVVRSWLGYRMKGGAGRRSSPLDEIRPDHWTPHLTQELIELLWVLEATVELQPALSDLLTRIVAGPVFAAAELPAPQAAERRPPVAEDENEHPTLGLIE